MQTNTEKENVKNTVDLALIKKGVVDVVEKKIKEFINNGELRLPPNYSPENAIKSAWLALQSIADKNGRPALSVCTRDSIANSLLDMVIQGLNPSKKQCYFVVYGNKLVCMRSYFGSMSIAKNIAGAKDIWAEVVYEGDEFEYEIRKNRKYITKHLQKIDNVKSGKIKAAYAIIEFDNGRPDYTEIMTIDQIKKAWSQGVLYKSDGDSTHHKFDDQMCKKTVINRACKAYINSSTDSSLLLESFNRADEEKVEQEVKDEISDNANLELIDVDYEIEQNDLEPDNEPAVLDKPAKLTDEPNF